MAALVIAEHDNASLKGATLNTVAAATAIVKIGGGDTRASESPDIYSGA